METGQSRLSASLTDRYRVERELGRGGMATVYLVHDLKHDRDVAIKVLHEDLGATLGPERFLAEIKTTARLQHPHILPLLDSGDAGGLLFYVMPYVAGETLRDRLTQTGLSLGTPQYMAPEQAMGEKTVGRPADIYALGAVTYEMLTGEPPFTGATVQAIVARVLSERPTPIITLRDTVPEHVNAAVMKALAKLPADRWAEARAFSDALSSSPGADTSGTSARTAARPAVSNDSRLWRLAVAALAVVAALGWFVALRPGRSTFAGIPGG